MFIFSYKMGKISIFSLLVDKEYFCDNLKNESKKTKISFNKGGIKYGKRKNNR